MKVLITGANGFTAKYLSPILIENPDLEVYLTDLNLKETTEYSISCDLSKFNDTYDLLNNIRPGEIYHLAGTYSNNYEIDYLNNVCTIKNILESSLKINIGCRILLIGSSAEYGLINEKDNPIKENYPLNPVSIYGITKVFQTYLMKYYHVNHKMDIVMARTFNLFGKGMSNKLFIGKLYEQIDEYKNGKIKKIVLGNLQNRRDYIDVKEAVKYYKLIMEKGVSGEIYNVGTRKSVKIYDLLKEILEKNSLSSDIIEERIIYNPDKIDINDIYADITKLEHLITHS